MPTYEYRCPDGHEFEQFVLKISLASSELPCPTCGKLAERRMSAGGGFVFKGSGFYITDYGKDGKKDQRDNAEKVAAIKPDVATKSESAKAESPARSNAATPGETTSSAGDKGDKNAKSGGRVAATPQAPKAEAPPARPRKEGGED